MNAVRLSLKAGDLPDSLLKIRRQIERDIPLGAPALTAGRKMSRRQARKVKQTEGVECRNAVLDEIPSAYKDIDKVMQDQSDLVEVVHILKAVLCVRGA